MEEPIGQTNATAGQAVVIAGGTVVVAILGLMMAGIPFVSDLGWIACFPIWTLKVERTSATAQPVTQLNHLARPQRK